MMNADEQFEVDLRAAMRAQPAASPLRHRILSRATPRSQQHQPRWLATLDPRNWRLPALMELGALAAAASLAVGVFAGASGFVLDSSTATASTTTDSTVDLVALAYDDASNVGYQQ